MLNTKPENNSKNENDMEKQRKQAENLLRELLIECGFNPYLTGYEYLVDAVLMCYDDPSLTRGKTKALYPMLAKKIKTDVRNIDRNIRTLVESAWRNRNSDTFYLRTDCHFIENNRRPSCSEIINILDNYVRQMMIEY